MKFIYLLSLLLLWSISLTSIAEDSIKLNHKLEDKTMKLPFKLKAEDVCYCNVEEFNYRIKKAECGFYL